MADSTGFQNVVTRTPGDAAIKAALRRGRSPARKVGRIVLWLGLMIAAAATLTPMTRYARQQAQTWGLLQNSEIALAGDDTIVPSPDYFEALSELATDAGSALAAARRSVEADPSRAFAWARISWLEAERAGKPGEASLDALAKSMDACPLCSEDLIRWRFNFVLANWGAMPETIRSRAFEHAELLSWSGENGEFLAEMRVKSGLAGIPFDTYRAAVKTPVSLWIEIPEAVATNAPAEPG